MITLYVRCDNGLVMWLPLEWPSEREANGMIMAAGSNKLHQQLVTNGSLSAGGSIIKYAHLLRTVKKN